MPIITFQPLQKTIEVDGGVRLFDAAKIAGLPIASSCGGVFACGKCVMRVVSGAENLSRQSDKELALLRREKRRVGEPERVSCVTLVRGDCTVSTGYW